MSDEAWLFLVKKVEYHCMAKQTGEQVFVDFAGFGEVGERDRVV